jgi:L-iditol 2-dehydrogenase
MKTGYLSKVGQVEIRELETPPVGDEEVLIKVKAAGICGSDIHAFHGTHPFRKPPMVLGHEVTGEVVRIGAGVKGIGIGDRVTVEPLRSCGMCTYCRENNYHLCTSRLSAGTGNWLGSFAEFFSAPADKVYVLPGTMDYDSGLLVESLAVGVHAVKYSSLADSETAVVIGTGPIGLLSAVAAQARGSKNIVCTDLNDYRLSIARELGFHTVNVSKDSIEDKMRELAPDGFDVAFLTVSSEKAVNQALRLVRGRGRVMVITIFGSRISFDLGLVQLREIEVKGSMAYTREDFQLALEILSENGERLKRVVTHHVGLAGIGDAIHLLSDPTNSALKIAVLP